MKSRLLILLAAFCCWSTLVFAQAVGSTPASSLPVIYIGGDAAIHFLSPEPIAYADVPGFRLAGDLPLKNVLRLKLNPDSVNRLAVGSGLGVVTITGESFIAQYRLVYTLDRDFIISEVEIQPGQCRPLETAAGLTTVQMKALANRLLAFGSRHVISHAAAYGVEIALNGIYTAGDYVFLDIACSNDSNLPYDTDELRFKIDDRKINKATNVQSVELSVVWQLHPLAPFKHRFHNVFVIRKATFPDHKVLHVELSEKQVSGRTVTLTIPYKAILSADAL